MLLGDPCQENGPTRFGTCQLPSGCSDPITDDLANCRGTFVGGVSLICCASGGETNPTTCTGTTGGVVGKCKDSCLSGSSEKEDGTCSGGKKCCVPSVSPPPTGNDCFNDFGGTCRLNSCNGTERLQSGADGCGSNGGVCCVSDTGGGTNPGQQCGASGGLCSPATSTCSNSLGGSDCGSGFICCKTGGGTGGGTTSGGGVVGFSGWNLSGVAGASGLPKGKIADIIISFMEWLLAIFAFIAIIGFLIAGVWYLTAAGDEGQIDRAKRAMVYSIIGVLVGLVGLVILFAVDALLSGDNVF